MKKTVFSLSWRITFFLRVLNAFGKVTLTPHMKMVRSEKEGNNISVIWNSKLKIVSLWGRFSRTRHKWKFREYPKIKKYIYTSMLEVWNISTGLGPHSNFSKVEEHERSNVRMHSLRFEWLKQMSERERDLIPLFERTRLPERERNIKRKNKAREFLALSTDKDEPLKKSTRFHLSTLSNLSSVVQRADLHFSANSFSFILWWTIWTTPRIWV